VVQIVLGEVREHLRDADRAVLRVPAAEPARRGRQAPRLGDVRGPERRVGVEDLPRIGAPVAKPPTVTSPSRRWASTSTTDHSPRAAAEAVVRCATHRAR
jgi:hypothetical protein